ncbi:hypothetical protein SprV_0501979200 [Sparganum proliferum]
MGSPLSNLVTELVLQELEKVAFSHYKPAFWRRYVDDAFVIIEKDKLSGFQGLLNSIFLDIQFTREDEEDEKLPFLEHKRAVRRSDPLSQVTTHTLEEGHEFDFANTRILARAGNKTGRELLEAWVSNTQLYQ